MESNRASTSTRPSPIQRSFTLGAGKDLSSLCSQPALRWPWPDDTPRWGIARLRRPEWIPLQAPRPRPTLALGPRVALETPDYPSLWLTDRSAASHKTAPPLPVPLISPAAAESVVKAWGAEQKGARRPAPSPPLPRPISAGRRETLEVGRCTLR